MKPNFFILGAAKSGTTSLHNILNQHPEIFMSEIKEPTFFCQEYQVIDNAIDYFRMFQNSGNYKIRGESSHAYLSSPGTPKVLKALFPEAKFVIILRNPVDRAYSLYNHMIRHGFEHISTFEKALKIETERFNSKSFAENCPHYFYNFMYHRSGLYGEQINRYIPLFDREQFLILTFEEFKTHPALCLRQIFKHLTVDPSFEPIITYDNIGKQTTKIPWIHYLFRNKLPEGYLQDFLYHKSQLYNVITTPSLSYQTRMELAERFQNDHKQLIEFDLSPEWYSAP